MTVRIGITGPIGCGKSTVAGRLGAVPGVVTIDADAVARDVLAPRTPESAAVIRRFGAGVRAGVDGIDRAALGRIVFTDPDALRDLEEIVHPAVRLRIVGAIEAAEAAGAAVVVIEAIKLVEGGLAALCDEVWLVTCPPRVQQSRVVARGATPEDAESRIRAQRGLTDRLHPRATRILDTSGTLEEVATSAAALLEAAIAERRR